MYEFVVFGMSVAGFSVSSRPLIIGFQYICVYELDFAYTVLDLYMSYEIGRCVLSLVFLLVKISLPCRLCVGPCLGYFSMA